MKPTLQHLLQLTNKYLTLEEQEIIKEAYDFAKDAHLNQSRKTGEPYFYHPLRVAEDLARIHSDCPTIIAGLFHDLLEDTNIKPEEIKKNFGEEILILTQGLTHISQKFSQAKYQDKEKSEKQMENLRNLFLSLSEDLRIVLIKLMDRLDNLRTLWVLDKEKQKEIANETLDIFAALAYRLGMGEIASQLEDLSFPYAYPKEYRLVCRLTGKRQYELKKYLEKITPLIYNELIKNDIKPKEIQYRAKHLFSIWRKLKKENMNVSRIYDLVAMRIIVNTLEECYLTLGVIHQIWKPVPGRFKDYIATPKPNGYRSLHTTVFGPNGRIIEIQIRTLKMHQEAEWGIAAHWYYELKKEDKNYLRGKNKIQFNLDRKFTWLKQLRDWQKELNNPSDFLDLLKNDFLKDRIYVLTPKGDVIDLPDGATPVDFAYQVHTEIGNQCASAKVNDKLVPLDYRLKSGEVVEILTRKGKKPSRAWLEFVKMRETKELIKKNLKK